MPPNLPTTPLPVVKALQKIHSFHEYSDITLPIPSLDTKPMLQCRKLTAYLFFLFTHRIQILQPFLIVILSYFNFFEAGGG